MRTEKRLAQTPIVSSFWFRHSVAAPLKTTSTVRTCSENIPQLVMVGSVAGQVLPPVKVVAL